MVVKLRSVATLLACSILSVGCSTHKADGTLKDPDPFEKMNRKFFAFNETADKYVLKPVTKGYQKVTPKPARRGIRNFFTNMGHIQTFANNVFQLDFHNAAKTFAGFSMNTTFGVLGLIDMAKVGGLEIEPKSFGDTLIHYGYAYSPYLVVPFVGPTTIRDGMGMYVDHRIGFMHNMDKFSDLDDQAVKNSMYALYVLQAREAYLDRDEFIEQMSVVDRYSFFKNAYLQLRSNQKNKKDVQNIKEKGEFLEEDY